jgi:MerR family transcriptional regulator, heat shock protein HspR
METEASNPAIWPRERVAEQFTVSTTTLLRWEGQGLVKAVRQGDLEGYGPVEIRRLWTILTFHRDLGINLAGIEVILRLRDEIRATHARLDELATALRSTLDEATSADDSDD